jgi:hypothetical protein
MLLLMIRMGPGRTLIALDAYLDFIRSDQPCHLRTASWQSFGPSSPLFSFAAQRILLVRSELSIVF